ncbi:MAG: hypothetical protein WBG17_07795 [Burkholderiaceae bacterium]
MATRFSSVASSSGVRPHQKALQRRQIVGAHGLVQRSGRGAASQAEQQPREKQEGKA